MNLLINVFLTEEKLVYQGKVFRENAKYSNKLDVYKYMLASLSDFYSWTKVIINTKLDDFYSPRRQELNEFILENFSKYNLVIKDNRAEMQKEWQELYDLFDDNLILYLGNHDHIFIDSDFEQIHDIINKNKNNEEYQAIQFSHWPEMMALPFCPWENIDNILCKDDHLSYFNNNVHSIQIINKNVYKYWWFEFKLPDVPFGRSDMFNNNINWHADFKKLKWISIYKEVARHFDGYQHFAFPIKNNVCPVLEIPEGFWDNDIKINYSTKIRKNMININPLSDKLKIFDSDGYDLNISKKYIPEFWKPRISEFIDDFSYCRDIWPDEELDLTYINRFMRMWDHFPVYHAQGKQFIMERIMNQNLKIKPFSL